MVGVAAAGGGGRGAEPFGDSVPCVVAVSGVGHSVGEATVGVGDEADEDRDDGSGVSVMGASEESFGVVVHPRSIERALERSQRPKSR